MADDEKRLFTEKERYLLDVQQRIDMAQLYPDGPEGKWLAERARLAQVNPDGPEARQIREEAQQAKHADEPDSSKQDSNTNKEAPKDVTPQQQENVDKALGETQLSGNIGGATDVNSTPKPNDPTPLEQSREIGQDLQKAGVTMEPDK